MNPIKKILIVRTDRIGDVVLTTPAIRALRLTYPQVQICVLVSKTTAPLLKGNPDIDEVMIDDRLNQHRGFWGYFKLIKDIQRRRFDLAIIFHTKKRTNLLCFLAGIPRRMGYQNNKLGFLLTEKIYDDRNLGIKHEAQYCLDLLKPLGVKGDHREVFVPIQPQAKDWVERVFADHRILDNKILIAIHPGASDPTKMWPAQYFVEVINNLIVKLDCQMVLIGAKNNQDAAPKIMAQVQSPLLDLSGQTEVFHLPALFKRCSLLISNDSGPVHIADAVGIPVISIFTRNQPGINPERWRPLGERSRFLAPPLQEGISFAKGKVIDGGYLKIIKPQDVLEAVDDIFKLC